jgi:hypothetical protein
MLTDRVSSQTIAIKLQDRSSDTTDAIDPNRSRSTIQIGYSHTTIVGFYSSTQPTGRTTKTSYLLIR